MVTSSRNIKVNYETEPPPMHSRPYAPSPIHTTFSMTPSKRNQSNGRSPVQTSTAHIKVNDDAVGFDDGPTFKEALRAFQSDSKSNVSSANNSFSMGNRSFNESQQIITSSTQQIQHTMHTTSSNKTYHVEES